MRWAWDESLRNKMAHRTDQKGSYHAYRLADVPVSRGFFVFTSLYVLVLYPPPELG
jgi:hypothetical protein